MANIEFLPVCSNCKNIILTEVDFDFQNSVIYPPICPVCKEPLYEIILHTKLPFQVDTSVSTYI